MELPTEAVPDAAADRVLGEANSRRNHAFALPTMARLSMWTLNSDRVGWEKRQQWYVALAFGARLPESSSTCRARVLMRAVLSERALCESTGAPRAEASEGGAAREIEDI